MITQKFCFVTISTLITTFILGVEVLSISLSRSNRASSSSLSLLSANIDFTNNCYGSQIQLSNVWSRNWSSNSFRSRVVGSYNYGVRTPSCSEQGGRLCPLETSLFLSKRNNQLSFPTTVPNTRRISIQGSTAVQSLSTSSSVSSIVKADREHNSILPRMQQQRFGRLTQQRHFLNSLRISKRSLANQWTRKMRRDDTTTVSSQTAATSVNFRPKISAVLPQIELSNIRRSLNFASGHLEIFVAQAAIALMTAYQTGRSLAVALLMNTKSFMQQYWWMFPMILCFMPLLHQALFHEPITTPNVWKMVNMEYILRCPDAAMVIGVFLGSNVAYYVAGAYLLHKFPARSLKPGMGLWLLMAGIISTIFHSVQAVGDFRLAEALCYVDHGIAGAATFYFWHVNGHPPASKLFWTLAVSALLTLSLPLKPGYAWLHSTWHFLSAAVAVLWAMEGKMQRKQRLFHLLRKRQEQHRHKQSQNMTTAILHS